MVFLLFGLAIFFASHLVPTRVEWRQALVGRFGELAYKLGFSLVASVGLVLIVIGVAATRGSSADFQIWSPPVWTRHLAFTVMLPAFVLVVSAYVPSHLRDWIGHPMVTGVALWAAAHLLANGDLLAVLLFGSFLIYAVYDRFSLLRRAPAPRPPARGWIGDAAAIGAGLVLWATTLLWLHALAGVPLLTVMR